MATEDKNKKSLFTRIDEALAGGELLLNKEAEKLKNPDDPDVRILERKNQYIFGVPSRHRSWYLYEPYTRYKRKENPDYKRYKKYSLAGTLAGSGMLVTGLASGNLPLAYSGAALTLTSLGYQSGHWWRQYATDQMFEKVPWPEEKVQEKLKEAKAQSEAEAKDKGLYQSLKRWIRDKKDNIFQYTNYHKPISFEKGPWCEDRWKEQAKEPKDEGLYIRRTHQTLYITTTRPIFRDTSTSPVSSPVSLLPAYLPWLPLKKPKLGHRSLVAITSSLSLMLGTAMFLTGGALGFVPLLYAAAAPPIYALGHAAGFLLSKNKAEPKYQKVENLENKVETMQDTYGSMTPAQPEQSKYKTLSKYEKELKK